jgi:plastocyanin
MRTTKVFLLLSTATAMGCGASAVPPAPQVAAQTPAKTEPDPIKAPANPGTIPVAKAGDYVTIKGKVTWHGEAPKPVVVNVTADKATCCKDGDLISTEIEVDAKTKGLKNVVVWVRPDTEERKDLFPQDKIHPDLMKPVSKAHVIDQPRCQFEPRVLVARTGDTLEVKNSSTIPHNINYTSDTESINPLIPAGASVKLKAPLAAQTSPIAFSCNIHPWMGGRMRVFDHPYFAITDKDGNFEIKNLPAGKWRLVYWHEKGLHKGRDGVLGFPVDVTKPAQGDTMELKPLEYEPPK